jgi:prenyltransferase beta subunit
MRRLSLILLAAVALVATAWAAPLDRAQREASLRYVNGLQNADGGFRPAAAPGNSQLGATLPCLRALKHLGGSPREAAQVNRFVQSCFDRESGGFADTPGGKPEVRSTAMGLMALAELKQPPGERGASATAYFVKNAQSVPEFYIAEAALDAAGLRPPDPQPWLAAFEATRNADGSYGKNVADTARAVVTMLRLKGTVKDERNLARLLKAAQHSDGGFGASGDASDLVTTYPVMRALFMLKERPDLERLRAFVARCRNTDGGYGPSPGQASTASATYMAAIVLHWAEDMGK